ncbi:hypothetical protein UY3_10230 [Chelonia mydas]|uniref:Uncharacterized protein n=1 Tax=Chelonia mydas TaxID=8469 RepID=M7BAL3_CHEMY|nr:hypothetical protein UY3_10230 [Chelonia mydas]
MSPLPTGSAAPIGLQQRTAASGSRNRSNLRMQQRNLGYHKCKQITDRLRGSCQSKSEEFSMGSSAEVRLLDGFQHGEGKVLVDEFGKSIPYNGGDSRLRLTQYCTVFPFGASLLLPECTLPVPNAVCGCPDSL